MHSELHTALNQFLHEKAEIYSHDKEKLNELYSLYDENARSTLNALQGFAELLYWYGIAEDGENKAYQHISPNTLISISTLLKNNVDMLDLSLFAKDKMGDCLYSLAQGK